MRDKLTVHDAEIAIAEILCQLEIDTDCLIHSVGISSTDISTVESGRVILVQRVVIELETIKGHKWAF